MQHHNGATKREKSTPYRRMVKKDRFDHDEDVFTNNIQIIRERQKLSRPELAALVRPVTTGQQIERLEKGQRKLSLDWVEKIARALHVNPLQLIMPLQWCEENLAGPRLKALDAQVAEQVALSIAKVVLRGKAPEAELLANLAALLQDLFATFAEHRATTVDPLASAPVIDILTRKYVQPGS